QALAIAPLIHLAVANASSRACAWLNAAPLVYIGKVSYTIYLCHHFLLCLVQKQWPQAPWIAVALIGLTLTLAIAEPMRRFVEEPCLRLRSRLHRQSVERPVRPELVEGRQLAIHAST